MPISSNIEKTIKELQIKNEDKKLLLDILKIEDDGVKQYTKDYENIINGYIKQKEEEQ